MPDFGDDEYKHMLCVEAAAVEYPITLKLGEEWKGRKQLLVVPSSYCSGKLDPHIHLLSSSMDKTVRLWQLSSKSCLKIFSHSDYDAKVRIWSIPDTQVVDWNDLHEMVITACYTPDGQIRKVDPTWDMEADEGDNYTHIPVRNRVG
ncbi:unnamed protein product [Lactuca virosa]|uniref:Uncharacterized protein n=1 Tax=Lactuca virosa TaxID=75947 RepID=A0AAU9LLC4_9ASTR|nr:unnamed protein product [Lactuca virosa]